MSKGTVSREKSQNDGLTLSSPWQAVLDEQRATQGVPGMSAAIIMANGETWLGTSGQSSQAEAVRPEMLFGLGSVSKIYLAALVMDLVEGGQLSLDDRVDRWLPPTRHVGGEITIRQLLNHTSGLHRYQGRPAWYAAITTDPDRRWTPQEILDTFVAEPACAPGACWDESATDYVLLGMIVERVTGRPAAEALRQRVLDPLGLHHTFLYPDETYPTTDRAHMWWDLDGSGRAVDLMAGVPERPLVGLFSSVWTAGALHATAEETALWIRGLFEGHILSDGSLREMVTTIQLGQSPPYGFSVIVDHLRGKTRYWHTGGIGYSAVFYYLPDDKLTIVVLSNEMIDLRPVADALYDAYLTQ